jgi:hypothetical protein
MEYIRKTYKVPAKRGGLIVWTTCDKRKFTGKILSAKSGHIRVHLNHYFGGITVYLHPTWNIEYVAT